MDREQKRVWVEDMHGRLQDSAGVFLADFRGVNVADDTAIRGKLREAGVDMKVVKNRLLLRALADTPFEGLLDELLEGPNAILISDDVVAAAKALKEALKELEEVPFEVKGGALAGTALTPQEIKKLASLPSREQLLGQLTGMLMSPLRNMATLLQAPQRDVLAALQALKTKKEQES